MAINTGQAASVVDFWHSVELFSPQTVPKIDRLNGWLLVESVGDDEFLPWQEGNRLDRAEGYSYTHTVFFGVFDIDAVFRSLAHVLPSGAEDYNQRPAGSSALASLRVNDHGHLVEDSGVASSLAWAAGRTADPGPDSPLWLRGFADAEEAVARTINGAQRFELDTKLRIPLEADDLAALRDRVAAQLGFTGIAPHVEIRIRSERFKDRSGSEEKVKDSADFLNSSFAEDLDHVAEKVRAGDISTALDQYLTPKSAINEEARVDLHSRPDASLEFTRPGRTSLGRWPSNPAHPLSLGQQFSANQIAGTLGAEAGIFAVNGPPGTGKSTLLRDVIADIVVRRAEVLAKLRTPADAFIAGGEHRWGTGKTSRVVQQWAPAFHGFEIVVASSNNGAVENISNEVPGVDAVHSELDDSDYFPELATALLNVDGGPDKRAWALLCARLGNSKNRNKFAGAMAYGASTVRRDGVQTREKLGILPHLKNLETAAPARSWAEAVAAYRSARATAATALAEREAAHQRWLQVRELHWRKADLEAKLDKAQGHWNECAAYESRLAADLGGHDQRRAAIAGQASAHQAVRLPWWRRLSGAAKSRHQGWLAHQQQLTAASESAERAFRDVWGAHQQSVSGLMAARGALDVLAAEHQGLLRALAPLDAAVARDRGRWAGAMPDEAWFSDLERRELAAPWTDPEVAAARSRVFLAALALHKDFLAHAPKQMRQSLHGALDIIGGDAPRDLAPEIVADAWRALFFLVPVVSTTFASFPRVFRGMGSGSLGWLLIDEAGQAAPQNAVGALWRARRAVIVGDPLQLEPVVTLSNESQQALRRAHGVLKEWLPGLASAQSLADRQNPWGTYLPGEEGKIWVGSPLRVHRRCADPMFTISNKIAYGGTMIHGARPEPTGPLAPSSWLHVVGDSQGHFVPAELARLRQELDALKAGGLDMSKVIAVSPFRDTATKLMRLKSVYPGLEAGTVHTAQGKEATVVFLVLGGNPASEGAKRWAAEKPNLVNVAVSRAKQRLYVIGDRDSWARHPRFDVMAEELAGEDCVNVGQCSAIDIR